MSRSSTPFTVCRVVGLSSALVLICLLIFQNHVLSAIDSLKSALKSSNSASSSSSSPTCNEPQTSPQEFYSFVDEDPTGWATRPLSEKGGFIATQYNETFTVSFGISMFHALHCIEMLREKIVDDKETMVHSSGDPTGPSDDDEEAAKGHLEHCLDYIVQVVMCGGDSTIEPPKLTLDDSGNVMGQMVAPEGNTHSCKNTNHLYNLAANSEKKPLPYFEAKPGDTVEKLFGIPGSQEAELS